MPLTSWRPSKKGSVLQAMPAEGVATTKGRVLSLYRDILRTSRTWKGGHEVITVTCKRSALIIGCRPSKRLC